MYGSPSHHYLKAKIEKKTATTKKRTRFGSHTLIIYLVICREGKMKKKLTHQSIIGIHFFVRSLTKRQQQNI